MTRQGRLTYGAISGGRGERIARGDYPCLQLFRHGVCQVGSCTKRVSDSDVDEWERAIAKRDMYSVLVLDI